MYLLLNQAYPDKCPGRKPVIFFLLSAFVYIHTLPTISISNYCISRYGNRDSQLKLLTTVYFLLSSFYFLLSTDYLLLTTYFLHKRNRY